MTPALMIFAAGLGTRLRPLTLTRPKALVEVAGRPLIDHALALAAEAGVTRIVVNTHYLAEQIHRHLAGRAVQIAHESVILETGGGLKAALPLLGSGPVLTLNADVIFTGENPLTRLMAEWRAGEEGLLMLTDQPHLKGDFTLKDGQVTRGGPLTYACAQMLDPWRMAEIPESVFSLNRLWDRQIAAQSLRGITHHGGWIDVGRPEALAEAEGLLTGGTP